MVVSSLGNETEKLTMISSNAELPENIDGSTISDNAILDIITRMDQMQAEIYELKEILANKTESMENETQHLRSELDELKQGLANITAKMNPTGVFIIGTDFER